MALEVIYEKLYSQEVKNFITGKKKTDKLLNTLLIKLQSLNNVYDDAEDKQLTNSAVRKWLSDLTEANFVAEDLLDKIKTESGSVILKRRKREAADGSGSSTSSKVHQFISTSFHKKMEEIIAKIKTKKWCKLEAADGSGSSTSAKVQLISTSFHAFDESVDTEIEEIIESLDIIAQRKDALELKTGARPFFYALPSTSLVEESRVYGRDEDKDTILKLLLPKDPLPWVCDSDDFDATGNKLDVIPIVGMGGIGKTTLAQLIYNDEKVTRHFNLRAWVSVSDDFDVFKITRTIYMSVPSHAKCENPNDLNELQVKLKEALTGKKFLFVLDDVWNENYDYWDSLRGPFQYGACGSKIIVTTRNEGVASVMGTLQTHQLPVISDEDCWLIFAKRAFENKSVSAYPNLKVIGRKIVEKCKGLPLAAKSLGGLLRSTSNEKEWKNVLESHIWELSDKCNILPALWLSYRYLPPHLKRCFAYSSIYPKDYKFEKRELVLLWMAEDLLQAKQKKMVEEVGEDYFNDLISRSFFQEVRSKYGVTSVFTMHDLVNDLAKFVSGDFCVRLEDNDSLNIMSKSRHFSYMKDDNLDFEKFEALCDAKFLRTFLASARSHLYFPNFPPFEGSYPEYYGWIERTKILSKVLPDLLLKLQCLRVLNLSGYTITELPDSVSDLIHLRYLNLSYTSIQKLPDAVCGLYNLQTLLLTRCLGISQLPTGFGRLIHLRHVDFNGTNLARMPLEMCKLKHLQQLPLANFYLDNETGNNIVYLKELQELHGELHISGLDRIVDAGDALGANMREKKYVTKLELAWGRHTDDSRKCQEVLDNLRPHTNIEEVMIWCYGGTNFPAWLGDDCFSNLVTVRLWSCENLVCLRTLLPSLRTIRIFNCPELESFPEGGLPCKLETLEISRCAKLVETRMQWGLLQLTSLRHLGFDFENCEEEIDSFPEEGLLPTTLTSLEFGGLSNLKTINSKELKSLISLQSLKIYNCPELLCLPDDGLPISLSHLRIYGCPLVRQRCKKDKGEDWPKISHIPDKFIC
ncbi:hypothetical protein M0R45_026420 [Rubus argutus]|uniref:Uncharacterized protein n=1 Tax=Rubus argutus TaxID=59490 RepID=A0AAW1WXI0_RUBAR